MTSPPAPPSHTKSTHVAEGNPHDQQALSRSSNNRVSKKDDLETLNTQCLIDSGVARPSVRASSYHEASNTEDENSSSNRYVSPSETETKKAAPVTWMSLPEKGQLAVLTIARLSEPLAERSLSAYLFYQLRSFDPEASDKTITGQGGMLTASFAAAQFLTAIWWGRAADSPRVGRKRVILIGLFGTTVSCIGVGFSRSFTQALFFRICAGCLNGNVGVMRTMISEIVKEKKYQSRAFLLLPMCFNIGVVIGPILGGFLAEPVTSFPNMFGPGSLLGGEKGVRWMSAFPYALPNVVSSLFILTSALCVVLGLNETHIALRGKQDRGRKLGKWLWRHIRWCSTTSEYAYHQIGAEESLLDASPLLTQDEQLDQRHCTSSTPMRPSSTVATKTNVPFRTIFKKNVVLTLLSHHLLAMHISAFNALIFLFLPAPRSENQNARLPFRFTGGLGLSSKNVGLATAIIGVIGFPLQLLVYPWMNTKLGTLPSYRLFLPFSILAYLSIPYVALLPDRPLVMWPILTIVLSLQVVSRTFALPGTTLLVNNSTPHPSVLGTIHGFAQSVSSGARTIGPTAGGWGLGLGIANNCVGAVWWAMACIAAMNWCLLWAIYEGDAGHSATSVH